MTLSRRRFLDVSARGIAVGALAPGVLGRAVMRDPFTELRRGVGTFTARGGTIGWLVHRDGSLVVDSQFPDQARECLGGLAARDALPLDALINTHHHGDHTAGNGVFREAARRIVAHTRVPELQRRAAEAGGAEAAQTYADTTFDDAWTVEIGDERVRATHRGRAHTAGDCTVHFERADVVHVGDLVFNRAYPFVDRAGGASVRGWIEVLEAVAAKHSDDTIFVFGHARPGFAVTGNRADVLVQRDLLDAALERARRALARGKRREEATAVERLPGFPDHMALSERLSLGATVGAAFDELAEDA